MHNSPVMGDDLAAANVNRTYSLGATSIAIFTFTMIFLYPRYVSGEADPVLFQATLIVMAVATFSLLVSAFLYYGASLHDRIDDAERSTYARRGDRSWMVGTALLFLAPSLVLFTIHLGIAGAAWLSLWLVYLLIAARTFPRVQTTPRS